jgi:hypothetical protein
VVDEPVEPGATSALDQADVAVLEQRPDARDRLLGRVDVDDAVLVEPALERAGPPSSAPAALARVSSPTRTSRSMPLLAASYPIA